MLTSIFSFLGGAVFRMIFGEIAAYFSKKQDHAQEMARMAFQAQADKDRAEQQRAAVQEQHAMGIETIRVQSEANISQIAAQSGAQIAGLEAQGWSQAVQFAITSKTGIWLIDAWNGAIRPSAATIALVLWFIALQAQNFKMGEWDKELVGMILGFFFASREMNKRGK